jgi:hypothetical protein
MKENLIWIGIHEYEIQNTSDLFVASITMFGTNTGNNYAYDAQYNYRFNYNKDYSPWNDYVNRVAKELLTKFQNSSFVFYESMEIDCFCDEIQKRAKYKNEKHIVSLLNNKFSMRRWVQDSVPSLPYSLIYGEYININYLKKLFPGYDSFVIQNEYSSGGIGTWLYNEQTDSYIDKQICIDKKYCITPYIENNIPTNITVVIYKDDIVLLNPSVQIMKINTYSFEYSGADFITYKFLPEKLKNTLIEYTNIICKKMQNIGYRGVCGIDFIFTEDQVYFMETNPRFQSSTFLLNSSFNDNCLNTSVQHLHINAFLENKNSIFLPIENKCEYSYFKLVYDKKLEKQIFYLINLCKNYTNEVLLLDDNFKLDYKLEDSTYIASLIFKKNITAISPEFTCRIHPNIDIYNNPILNVKENEWIYIKIMLLNHGINLTNNVKEIFNNAMNYKEFNALDLVLDNKYYMNIPYQDGLSYLSPFFIDLINNQLKLYCYTEQLSTVQVRSEDPLGNKKTKNNIYYRDISYLSNDRLRLYYRDGCYFKDKNKGCKFCDIDGLKFNISLDDIDEILETYKDHPAINHYLIGGGASAPDSNFNNIVKLVQLIRKYNNKPIYLMSLPPEDVSIIAKLKQAGITEVAFNLEIYNREIAKFIMPGKGQISLNTYFEAFRKAIQLFGKTGNVRTIFIVGLETKKSLLEGVEAVCSLGVSPILSRFKAIEHTELEHMLSPSDKELYEIYKEVNLICEKYNIPLGPTCKYCEDNTIKLTE